MSKTLAAYFSASGFGKTVAGLKPSVAADAAIMEGKLLNGRQSEASLKSWVNIVI